MQNVTLKFHPNIQKYTNGISEHTVNVIDLADIRNCLEYLFPRLSQHIRRISSGVNRSENMALVNKHKRLLQQEDFMLNRLRADDTEFHVVPLLIGGGGKPGTAQIIIGAIIMIAAIVAAPTTGGMSLAAALKMPTALGISYGAIAMMGAAMMLSGVISMMMKPSKQSVTGQETSDAESRDNKLFGGLSNTIASNTPIPMIYGRTRVAGQFISGDIRTYEHGRNETVLVNSLFPTGAS